MNKHKPLTQFDLGPWLVNLNGAKRSGHSVTIAVLGSTNSDWIIGGNLMMWRGQKVVTGGTTTTTVRPTSYLPDSVCIGEEYKTG